MLASVLISGCYGVLVTAALFKVVNPLIGGC